MVFFTSLSNSGLADGVDVTGQVQHLAGEAPLVVVPSHELDKVVVQGQAGLGVEDGGVSIGAEVGGDDLASKMEV